MQWALIDHGLNQISPTHAFSVFFLKSEFAIVTNVMHPQFLFIYLFIYLYQKLEIPSNSTSHWFSSIVYSDKICWIYYDVNYG